MKEKGDKVHMLNETYKDKKKGRKLNSTKIHKANRLKGENHQR